MKGQDSGTLLNSGTTLWVPVLQFLTERDAKNEQIDRGIDAQILQ